MVGLTAIEWPQIVAEQALKVQQVSGVVSIRSALETALAAMSRPEHGL
jgi:hypothetical protein